MQFPANAANIANNENNELKDVDYFRIDCINCIAHYCVRLHFQHALHSN